MLSQLGQFHSDCRTILKKAIGQQEMEAHRDLIQEETRNLIPALSNVKGDPWETINSYANLFSRPIRYSLDMQENWSGRHSFDLWG